MTLKTCLLVAASALMLGAIYLVATGNREPVYEGRTLGNWLEDLDPFAGGPKHEAAKHAVNVIGTNGFLTLFRLLTAEDSAVKMWCMTVLSKQSIVDFNLTVSYTKNMKAVWGFDALGEAGNPAIPRLVNMLHHDARHAGMAAQALSRMSREGMASLISALDDRATFHRPAMAISLSNAKWETERAVSVLMTCLKDSDANVRQTSAVALGHTAKYPDRVVPALAEALSDPDQYVRLFAAKSLGDFGAAASSAVPQLLKSLDDPVPDVRDAASQALIKIGHTQHIDAKH